MKKKPTKKPSKKETLAASFALPDAPERIRVDESAVRDIEARTGPAAAASKQRKDPAAGSKLRRQESGARFTAYIPPDMRKKIRVLCAQEDRSVSDAATEAFGDWLAKKAAERKGA